MSVNHDQISNMYPLLLIVLAAILWGTSFIAVRWGLEYITPVLFVFFRFSLAVIILTPFFLSRIQKIKKLLLKKDVIIIGLINALAFLSQFIGQQNTTAGKASLFVNFYVIIVPIFSPLVLKEKYHWSVLISGVIGVSGVFFISTNLNFSQLSKGTIMGDLIILLSSLAWTAYIIISKNFLNKNPKHSSFDIFSVTLLWTTLFLLSCLPFVFFQYSIREISLQITFESVLAVCYLSIICTVVAFGLYTYGLKQIEAGPSSILMLIEVLVAFVLEAILFTEIPTIWTITGGILVFFSIVIISIREKTKKI